ncbi:MAG: cytochrome c biogenesis CcdA family protein [Acidimicrobiia bacterium]
MAIESVDPAAYAIAFGGGVVSFLSPCVLPLLPAYLSIVSGVSVGDLTSAKRGNTRRVASTTGMFVAGFSLVFILLGLSATTVGRALFDNQIVLTRASGAMVMAMGLFLIGSLIVKAPWMYRELRFHPELGRFGAFAPAAAGVAFGFGWTPCIGPVLGSILTISASQQRPWAGGTLLATYSLGLGIPFLLSGVAFHRVAGALGFMKRHAAAVTVTSAVSLTFFGALLILNRLIWVTTVIQDALRSVGLERLVELG